MNQIKAEVNGACLLYGRGILLQLLQLTQRRKLWPLRCGVADALFDIMFIVLLYVF